MAARWAVLRSVRVRLLVIALLPMLVLLPLLLGATMWRWSDKIDGLLVNKVTGDLTIAHQYLARLIDNSGERIDAVARSAAFRDRLAAGDVAPFLAAEQKRLGLDFLRIDDGSGGDDGFAAADWPVIAAALAGRWSSEVDILDAKRLEALAPGLAARAAIALVPTRAAVPTDRDTETRGMIIHSAAPVTLMDGRRAALVGVLLNRNLDFIDTINTLVYRGESLPEGSQGTATLFLEDVRVSTNVRLFENVRALGTRVSAEVRARVLGAGEVWLDRAFVVNDWYISAYEPIRDSHGARVGMLYVGFLENPFRNAKMVSVLALVLAFILIAMLSVPIFLRWAGRIFMPLEAMTKTIARVEAGDLSARNTTRAGAAASGPVSSPVSGPVSTPASGTASGAAAPADNGDEISRVANHLDALLDQLQERDRQLRQWAESLESKVAERTADLVEANRHLERATEQLIMSEKLAAVGEITASVAHEINNPVAVIQGNLDLMRTVLGDSAELARDEFALIDDQVYRINVIVSKLLQFARPEEYSGSANVIAPAEVVRDCLVLTRHQIEHANIETATDLDPSCRVLIARTELQQVLVNLMLNAVQVMPEGGRLSLSVRWADPGGDDPCGDLSGDKGDRGGPDGDRDTSAQAVLIAVEDTGTGIAPELRARIFDPFFTTKQARGTGLGLSISQQLISRAGGRISVCPGTDGGSRFEIFLPAATLG